MLPDSMYEYRPEEPRAIAVDVCFQCSKDINLGEDYYSFNGDSVCEECLDEYIRHFKKVGEKNE